MATSSTNCLTGSDAIPATATSNKDSDKVMSIVDLHVSCVPSGRYHGMCPKGIQRQRNNKMGPNKSNSSEKRHRVVLLNLGYILFLFDLHVNFSTYIFFSGFGPRAVNLKAEHGA